jgi:hypothetical protein
MLRRRPLESELEERIHPEDEPAFGLGGAPQIAVDRRETLESINGPAGESAATTLARLRRPPPSRVARDRP